MMILVVCEDCRTDRGVRVWRETCVDCARQIAANHNDTTGHGARVVGEERMPSRARFRE